MAADRSPNDDPDPAVAPADAAWLADIDSGKRRLWGSPDRDGQSPETVPTTLLLSLFLLVLAFFIVLVGLAEPRDDRSTALLQSVSRAFTGEAPAGRDPRMPAAEAGDVLAGVALPERLDRLFATALDVARIETDRRGGQLSVSVPAAAVFADGGAGLRPAARRVFGDVAIAVGARPPGVRVAVEAVLGRDTGPGVPPGLAVRRAGALGAALAGRGLAPGLLSVGVDDGPADRVRLVFDIDADPTGRPDRPVEAVP